jgi:hypothetical protein
MNCAIGFYDTDQAHVIEFDYAGFNGWPRFTCYDCKENATCLRQPYMNAEQWDAKKTEFFKQHGNILQNTHRNHR